MSTGPRQLALALDHAESFAREDFLSGPSNAVALALIDAWPGWPHRTVMLTGPEGSGKSHLAAIWAQAAGARLIAIPVVSMAAPDDALLRAVLVKLFADRQLAVDEGLIGYVAMRIERSFAAARAAVARLDDEAMRRKRPLTRTFAAEILRAT